MVLAMGEINFKQDGQRCQGSKEVKEVGKEAWQRGVPGRGRSQGKAFLEKLALEACVGERGEGGWGQGQGRRSKRRQLASLCPLSLPTLVPQ